MNLRRPLICTTLGLAVLLPGQAASASVWPLDPRPTVVKHFDAPEVRWGAGHRGVDLAGSMGQPVRAIDGGRITFAATLAGRGVVTVTHGGIRTTYEPVERSVSRGDVVAPGQVIGRLQLWGSHCLPAACLHHGALRGETYLDPLTLLGAAPVRLKPLGAAPAPAAPRRSWAAAVGFAPLSSIWWTARPAGGPVGTPF